MIDHKDSKGAAECTVHDQHSHGELVVVACSQRHEGGACAHRGHSAGEGAGKGCGLTAQREQEVWAVFAVLNLEDRAPLGACRHVCLQGSQKGLG